MYFPIRDYALIGDTRSAALVSSCGSIDWLCLPDFDSPAVFLRILDDDKGGFCEIVPEGLTSHSRSYIEKTNILETRLETSAGSLVITDFMPIRTGAGTDDSRGQDVIGTDKLVRMIRCERGPVDFTLRVRPTFNYANDEASRSVTIHIEGNQVASFKAENGVLRVRWNNGLVAGTGEVTSRVRMQPGEEVSLILGWYKPDAAPQVLPPDAAAKFFERTRDYWQQWAATCTYRGPYADAVLRSALTLKMLIFEETGAVIAAPTTSLPECVGGQRNWDYRYSWLRDSSLTLSALMDLGYMAEAHDFMHFLHTSVSESTRSLRVLYGIHGN